MEITKKKNLLTIGRFVEKLDYKTNIQDYTTWKSMGKYFDNIYIIVQSPDRMNHTESIGNLHVFWIANKSSVFVSRLYFMLESFRVSKGLIKRGLIDIINLGEPAVAGFVGVKLKKRFGLPLVTQVQGQLMGLPAGTFPVLKIKYIEYTTKYTCMHSEVVRTVSKEIAQTMIDKGIPKEKVKIVQSRCDTKKFDPALYKKGRKELRAKLGYKDDDIIIIFTGRVVQYRDLESDIRALKILQNYDHRFRLLIVGEGDDMERLKKLSSELEIEEKILFFGKIPFDQIPRYLSIADIFISTPTNEAISRSVLEAMSMGMPVIATAVGGTPEAIVDGVNGMLVGVKNPEEIASKIKELVVNFDNMKRMGEAARETILSVFDYDKQIEKLARIHYDI